MKVVGQLTTILSNQLAYKAVCVLNFSARVDKIGTLWHFRDLLLTIRQLEKYIKKTAKETPHFVSARILM